jgi:hypothetical protein
LYIDYEIFQNEINIKPIRYFLFFILESINMKPFSFLFTLFVLNNKKTSKPLCSTSFSKSYDMHITKNNYTDTTSELEDLLTNKYSYRRKSLEGTDEHIIDDRNTTSHREVIMNLYKYGLLQLLQNKDIPESNKLEYIQEWEKMDSTNKYIPDISKGILFSDW